MGAKTKKIRAAGKFSAGIGVRARKDYISIASEQGKKQISPINPKGRAKRIAAGIWKDLKTGRIFAGPAYVLNSKE
jgi:ribosomal protein L37AE/L43A